MSRVRKMSKIGRLRWMRRVSRMSRVKRMSKMGRLTWMRRVRDEQGEMDEQDGKVKRMRRVRG